MLGKIAASYWQNAKSCFLPLRYESKNSDIQFFYLGEQTCLLQNYYSRQLTSSETKHRKKDNTAGNRLDFRRSLVSGLRPSREERVLFSRTASGDRAYAGNEWMQKFTSLSGRSQQQANSTKKTTNPDELSYNDLLGQHTDLRRNSFQWKALKIHSGSAARKHWVKTVRKTKEDLPYARLGKVEN